MIIENVKIVLNSKVIFGNLYISNNRIERVEEKPNSFDSDLIVYPGVVDLHTHGSGGYDYMDGGIEPIIKASYSALKNGTTTLLPTTLASSDDDLFTFLEAFKAVIAKKQSLPLPNLYGVHLEGPYFNLKQRGAQDERYICAPNEKHYSEILKRSEGVIKRFSLAPELNGASKLISLLAKNDILVSAAHTEATYDDIKRSLDDGLKLLTHFYSGMNSITRENGYRILGAIEAGFMLDDLKIELICDGIHLPHDLLSYIFKFKNKDKIISTTDSMRAAGLGDGKSILGPIKSGQEVIVEDNVAKVLDRSCFAGSVATGDTIIKTLIKQGLEPFEIARISSLQPAELINKSDEIGSIEVGKLADLIVFDNSYNLKKVYKSGVCINEL